MPGPESASASGSASADASADAERVHELMMDLVRFVGLLQPDHHVPGFLVSASQAFALHELGSGPGLSQGELADRLHLEKSSASRMAADMERDGLLARERDPNNRRQYRLRLTDRGHALHRQMASSFHNHYERWISAMTPAERAALIRGLRGLLRAVRQSPVQR
jgi:DNA-binding MarR family transcriptional regulator